MSPAKREAQKHVLYSYTEKLLVVVVAIAAFTALLTLGDATEQRKFAVNAEFLDKLATKAAQMGGDPSAQKTDAICRLRVLADTFAVSSKPTPVAPAEATAQVEHLADAAIWDDFRAEIDLLSASISNAQKDDKKSHADALAAADARARGRISAVHALVDAAVPQLDQKAESFWQAAADEKSSLHVVYEIVWYALLIVGVLACSYLLMIVFVALPFTSLSSHWTDRIDEILKGAALPQAAKIALAPLAAAALIAGTVAAGASYATEPGGISRDYSTHIRNEFGAPKLDYSPTTLTYPMTMQKIDDAPIIQEIQTAKSRISDTIDANARAVQNAYGDAAMVMDAVRSDVAETREEATGAAATTLDAQRAARRASVAADWAAMHSTDVIFNMSDKAHDISAEQSLQKATQSRMIAQTASADTRGFWRRTFGFTMFEVGPGVVDAIDARMAAEHCTDDERATMRTALTATRDETPANRWAFGKSLERHGLGKDLKDRYFRALLHLCELPR